MRDTIKSFLRRDAGLFAQFVKYAAAGVLATVVDTSVFYICAIWLLPALGTDDPVVRLFHLHVDDLATNIRSYRFVFDKIISFIFSNFTAYVLNIWLVFERGRHRWHVEIGLFYAVSAISVGIGVALGWALIYFLNLSTTVTFITQAIATLMINFICRKVFIFKR